MVAMVRIVRFPAWFSKSRLHGMVLNLDDKNETSQSVWSGDQGLQCLFRKSLRPRGCAAACCAGTLVRGGTCSQVLRLFWLLSSAWWRHFLLQPLEMLLFNWFIFFCVSDTTGHQPSFGSSMAANFTGKRSTDGRRLRTTDFWALSPSEWVTVRSVRTAWDGVRDGIHNSVG